LVFKKIYCRHGGNKKKTLRVQGLLFVVLPVDQRQRQAV